MQPPLELLRQTIEEDSLIPQVGLFKEVAILMGCGPPEAAADSARVGTATCSLYGPFRAIDEAHFQLDS